MISINKKIALELINLINKNASVIQISNWADKIYSDHFRELDPEMENLITRISFMQHGKEFEIEKKDLEGLAQKFLNN